MATEPLIVTSEFIGELYAVLWVTTSGIGLVMPTDLIGVFATHLRIGLIAGALSEL